MPDIWAEAMIELNNVLELCKDSGVTKDEILNEIEKVYGGK